MKLHKSEVVTRYHVSFLPHEARTIDQHEKWRTKIHVRPARAKYQRGADAMLTRSDINDICDVLGINGREFMEKYNK